MLGLLPGIPLRMPPGVPMPGSPEELAKWQEKEIVKLGEIVHIAGMKEP